MADDGASSGATAELSGGLGTWLAYFGLATAGTVCIVLANPGQDWRATAASVAAVLVSQAIYFAFARPSVAGIRANGPRAWIFVATAVPLFIAAVALNRWAALSLFALTPQVFLLLTFGFAAAAIVVMNLGSTAVQIATGTHALPTIVEQIGIAVFVVVFSLFFGSRMLAIAERSAERLRLITQLREREAEVAALSAARGAEQERTRIAREMHDTLAQGFASIVTLGHAAQTSLSTDPDAARRQVDLITRTAQENLAESRRIIHALSPSRLEQDTLADALARIVASFQEETGIAATFTLDGDATAVAPAEAVVVLRIVQESLANIRKHAHAARVGVELTCDADMAGIRVDDDGDGFDAASPSAGYGLAGMRARVAENGGTIDIRSSPGAGTTVSASIPIGATR